jgi:hypothetical protein
MMSASKNNDNNNNNNNSNSNNDEIAPDTPVFTSMLIRSASPAMPGPRSVNHVAKQQRFEAPVLKSRAPLAVESNTATASWEPHRIPQLPEYYPLERSHVSMKNVDRMEVCNRIAECLRTESVSATFTEVRAAVLLDSGLLHD